MWEFSQHFTRELRELCGLGKAGTWNLELGTREFEKKLEHQQSWHA